MGDYGKEASESCSQHCVALDDDAQYTTKYNYDPRHRIRGLKSFLSRYIALFVPYPLIVKKIWILSGSATLFFFVLRHSSGQSGLNLLLFGLFLKTSA